MLQAPLPYPSPDCKDNAEQNKCQARSVEDSQVYDFSLQRDNSRTRDEDGQGSPPSTSPGIFGTVSGVQSKGNMDVFSDILSSPPRVDDKRVVRHSSCPWLPVVYHKQSNMLMGKKSIVLTLTITMAHDILLHFLPVHFLNLNPSMDNGDLSSELKIVVAHVKVMMI